VFAIYDEENKQHAQNNSDSWIKVFDSNKKTC
jgi:hypothetical protein